jgi:plasmid stability protein
MLFGFKEVRMTTTITLPESLARQLEQRASAQQLSVEALAIEYLTSALHDDQPEALPTPLPPLDEDPELLALVARIKAMPPNPASIIPARGNLAEVLRTMAQGEPDQELLDALDAAEQELRALDRANDIAEGRG